MAKKILELTTGMKKVVSIVLVAMMVICLAGCGSNTEQKDEKVTTEDLGEEQDHVNIGVDEANQEIEGEVDLTTEEDTEASSSSSNSGKYTYEAYGVEVSMDINIDDYITTTNEGLPFFKLLALANDCGWQCLDEDGDYKAYVYKNGDMDINLRYAYFDDSVGGNSYNISDQHQISDIDYKFTKTSDYLSDYYDDGHSNEAHGNLDIDFSKHYPDCQYIVPGVATMSRDDIIIIAYLFSFVKSHTGENPFSFANFSEYLDNENSGTYIYEF